MARVDTNTETELARGLSIPAGLTVDPEGRLYWPSKTKIYKNVRDRLFPHGTEPAPKGEARQPLRDNSSSRTPEYPPPANWVPSERTFRFCPLYDQAKEVWTDEWYFPSESFASLGEMIARTMDVRYWYIHGVLIRLDADDGGEPMAADVEYCYAMPGSKLDEVLTW